MSSTYLPSDATERAAATGKRSASRSAGLRFLFGLGVLATLVLLLYPLFTIPAEDAVILFQYSRNLAETGVISYIPWGPRAEGATDFLWMAYIAGALRLHIAPAVSLAVANLASCVGLAWVLLRLAGRRWSLVAAMTIVGGIACLPQMLAALEGFSVLPFTCAIALLVLALSEQNDVFAALSALLLCMLRPDGVVFALPLLLRQLWLYPRARTVRTDLLCFVLPGIGYFLWRWRYFHHFLPLPFLVKSDTHRVLGLFDPGSLHILPYVLLAIFVIGIALQNRLFTRERGSLFVAMVVVPTLFYCAMRLDQNVDDRFYAYLPLAAALLIALDWRRLAIAPLRFGLLTALAVLLLTSLQTAKGIKALVRQPVERKRERDLAQAISRPGLRGTMLVSESGLVPYYSRWRAYDTWGLNTPQFATHLIQPSEVVSLSPDVILLHGASTSQECRPAVLPPVAQRSWDAMITNVRSGIALSNHYETWRVPFWSSSARKGFLPLNVSDAESFCWYVSDTYPERQAFEAILQGYGGVPQR